mmetsp:Transcript_56213/g.133505  ORF Transcript_56213/g.133505 Transcript_56213/m.133505 type:complete len:231 (+) Transcript_56213:2921-3613(+)
MSPRSTLPETAAGPSGFMSVIWKQPVSSVRKLIPMSAAPDMPCTGPAGGGPAWRGARAGSSPGERCASSGFSVRSRSTSRTLLGSPFLKTLTSTNVPTGPWISFANTWNSFLYTSSWSTSNTMSPWEIWPERSADPPFASRTISSSLLSLGLRKSPTPPMAVPGGAGAMVANWFAAGGACGAAVANWFAAGISGAGAWVANWFAAGGAYAAGAGASPPMGTTSWPCRFPE